MEVLAPSHLSRAAALLRAGELVAFPTDTVYGVGAIAWEPAAVSRLYSAKLRPADKAIPVLLADAADIGLVARDVGDAARRIAARFWPGPLTIVVPAAARLPREVTAGGETVAVRVPDHEIARALIRAAGAPLATTSANLSGEPSAVTAAEAAGALEGRIAAVVDGGRAPGGTASTIVDLTGPQPVVVRQGPLSLGEILASLC